MSFKTSVVTYIHDIWKSKLYNVNLKDELEFCENRINLNHVLDFDPFLNDLIDYDTLLQINEVSEN